MMDAPTLFQALQSPKTPLLIHVLPEATFAARHIPNACNACVYETAFLQRVAEIAPDKACQIVVYGAGGGSLDAVTAAEKLQAAGYLDVRAFEGGLDEWVVAGLPCEGDGMWPEAPTLDGKFLLNTEESLIRWTGRNLFNHHHGTMALSSGEIVVKNGAMESARFTVDMSKIVNDDLEDGTWNAMLIQHLQDADFFDIAHHPTAEFVATSAHLLPGATPGMPTHVISGDFTLRGVTKPVEILALIATGDGRRLTGQCVLDIDRTEFGSVYGSGKFFRFLGGHVVNNVIHLHVKIHADKLG